MHPAFATLPPQHPFPSPVRPPTTRVKPSSPVGTPSTLSNNLKTLHDGPPPIPPGGFRHELHTFRKSSTLCASPNYSSRHRTKEKVSGNGSHIFGTFNKAITQITIDDLIVLQSVDKEVADLHGHANGYRGKTR